MNIDIIGISNLIVLIVTAYIVWKYTLAAQKSNEIQERPILNMYLREENVGSNSQYTLRLRNVGNGPAYNIHFSNIPASGYTYCPYFKEANPILEKNGDEKTVNLWVKTPNNGVEVYDNILGIQFFIRRVVPRTSESKEYEKIKRTSAIFLISYEGINGNKYYSIFRLYSKIIPLLPGIYDFVVEFIDSKNGDMSYTEVYDICKNKETLRRFEE